MDSFKTVWILGFLLIYQPSLVRCQSLSPKHIFTCIEVLANGIADVSKEISPKLQGLFDCVRFVPKENLEDLDKASFRSLVSAFLLKLVNIPSCLDTYQEKMTDLIKPHMSQYNKHKCAYLYVAPQCWPSRR